MNDWQDRALDDVVYKTSLLKRIRNLILWNSGAYKIRGFFQSLARASQYLIFGWKHPDWDCDFFVDEMIYKIKRMKEYHLKYGVTERNEKKIIIEKMDEVVSAFEYMREHDFLEDAEKNFIKEYGALPKETYDSLRDETREEDIIRGKDGSVIGHAWRYEYSYDDIPVEKREAAKKDWDANVHYKRSEEAENAAIATAFHLLRQNYRYWWD